MVRLLPVSGMLTRAKFVFQSHNGAIAAYACSHCGARAEFVSIPQWCDCCYTTSNLTIDHHTFQSHNGAIAANLFGRWFAQSVKFQSHNGAIAAKVGTLVQSTDRHVSIPQWCDCCLPCSTTKELSSPGFNPTMVRLLPHLAESTC